MSPLLTAWNISGKYIAFGPFKLQLFVKQLGNPAASAEKTLLLIHGFPESSYSYNAIVDGMLATFDRIILFDMPGYGFSDKPIHNFAYSIFEQADTAFAVWKHFGIKGGHVLSHDMGNSVATEILARHENDLMPAWFSDGLQSITFTNGSIVLKLASLRVTQKILLSKYGHLLNYFTTFQLFNQQVKSAQGNKKLSAEIIQTLWEINTLQDGHKKAYLTIKYIKDRRRFEKTRWLPALKQTSLPIHLCWGDADAVARIEIAHYLKMHICTDATLTVMEGLGHFCQLGSPGKWVAYVRSFYTEMI